MTLWCEVSLPQDHTSSGPTTERATKGGSRGRKDREERQQRREKEKGQEKAFQKKDLYGTHFSAVSPWDPHLYLPEREEGREGRKEEGPAKS